MYLEISDRQSGKTMRLINQIIADEPLYDIQILISCSDISLKTIVSHVYNKQKIQACNSFTTFQSLLLEHYNQSLKLYADEFLFINFFCKNFDNIFSNYANILSNGYFVSSINPNYHNIFTKLLEYNHGNYIGCYCINAINFLYNNNENIGNFMFIFATIRCWLYKLSHYEYQYGSSIKYNKLTEYTYNYEDINNG